MTNKYSVLIGAICAALAVLAGAFGAHGLHDQLTANNLAIYETAVKYQFYHAFALIILGFIPWHNRARVWAGRLFIAGIVLFCGSLYLLSVGPSGIIGKIFWVTPLGGVALVAGWISLAWSVWSARKK